MNKILEKIREVLGKKRLSAFVVTNLKNVRYLSGFTGSSAFVLITKKQAFFITDFRYKEQSARQVSALEVVISKGSYLSTIKDILKQSGIKRIGFEYSAPYSIYDALRKDFYPVPVREIIENIRKKKSATELKLIRQAIDRAETAFLSIKRYIKPGVTERSIALRLEEAIKKQGSRMLPFDIIVASGENSALPHAGVSERKLRAGDLVVVDWGAEANGYFSDMTRTFLLKGKNLQPRMAIYDIVLKANRAALKKAKTAMVAMELDRVARDIINAAGYGEYFGHGTGHGVGLDIHEAPRISFQSRDVLEEGMVFTIEPGIYISDIGGVRIEDMVCLGSSRARVLTSLPKELEIL